MSAPFCITDHARQRFVERFSKERTHFSHLSHCKLESCEVCRDLTYWLNDLVKSNKVNWDKIMMAKLYDADEVKLFYNDTNFMEQVYTKYGYGRFSFWVEGWILFIIREDNGKRVVVTCINANNPVHGSRMIANFINRPRYNRRNCEKAL